MELVIAAIVILVSVYMGYKMGKGEPIKFPMKRLKPVIRTEAQEAELEKKIERGLR